MASKTLQVDVIIPVHDARRAIDRAVQSIVGDPAFDPQRVRVTVVCHNIPSADIVARLGSELARSVRIIELADDIPSPAGPFALGLRMATAEFVSIMGSDDWLESGALQAWLKKAADTHADVVIAPQRHQSGSRIRTPPVRPFRRRALNAFRDRLVYRTAPLGIMRRDVVKRLGLEFPSHLRNGSDQLFTLSLWYSDARAIYPHGAPSYVVGADAPTRVTTAPRPAEDELRAVAELVESESFTRIGVRSRRGIVAKLVRVHIFSGALVRSRADRWDPSDRLYFGSLLERFNEVAPGYHRLLSYADRALLEALRKGTSPNDTLAELLVRRARFGRPSTVITPDVRGLFAVHGPLRLMISSRLL